MHFRDAGASWHASCTRCNEGFEDVSAFNVVMQIISVLTRRANDYFLMTSMLQPRTPWCYAARVVATYPWTISRNISKHRLIILLALYATRDLKAVYPFIRYRSSDASLLLKYPTTLSLSTLWRSIRSFAVIFVAWHLYLLPSSVNTSVIRLCIPSVLSVKPGFVT